MMGRMIRLLRRLGRYASAALTGRFNELADPKIQLEQAIDEAKHQHRLLVDQAANVIGNQKSIEMQLNRKVDELEKMNLKARQAVLMADDEQQRGNLTKATEFTNAAESFAGRLVSLDAEVESLKTLHGQASQASDQAKAAVKQNSTQLQKKLADRQRLMNQLDQAKMQERMNSAMDSLSATVGGDVPTFDEVQRKIEERQAKALGHAEIHQGSFEAGVLEVERAAMDMEATLRLAKIKLELGIGDTTAGEISKKSKPSDG